MTSRGVLTMRHARRLHRACFTHAIETLDQDGKLIARRRVRTSHYKPFRAWLRAEHRSNPLPWATSKLHRIVNRR